MKRLFLLLVLPRWQGAAAGLKIGELQLYLLPLPLQFLSRAVLRLHAASAPHTDTILFGPIDHTEASEGSQLHSLR